MSSCGFLTVALVLDDDLDRPDGVQQYVLTLADALRSRGHDVHLIAPSTVRTDLPNLHVVGRHVAASFNGNRVRTPLPVPAAKVSDVLARIRPDVLHIQMPHSPLLAGRFVRAAADDVAVVGTFHIAPGSWAADAGARILGLLERRELRRFDAVMTMSDAGRDFAASALHLHTERATMPVDLRAWSAAADAAPTADADDPVQVVFLGRLVERKGARQLLAAIELMVTERLTHRRWKAVIAGRGPQERELTRFVADHGLTEQVDLIGFVAEPDKAPLLASGDVVVLPSTGGESFGISVVEALAAARGVVLAGDNAGYRTPMAGLEAQLITPDDPWSLAVTLARWIDDPTARAAAAAPQRACAARFDASGAIDELEELYRRSVARRYTPSTIC